MFWDITLRVVHSVLRMTVWLAAEHYVRLACMRCS